MVSEKKTQESRQLVQEYADYMRRKGVSEASVVKWAQMLDRFLRHTGTFQVSAKVVNEWLDAKNFAPRSRNWMIAGLRNFYRWALEEGHLTADPMTRVYPAKLRRALPRPISDQDLVLAIDHAPPRIKAWILLGAYGGLRSQEIAGLKREDLLIREGLIRIEQGKGGKERIIPLHPEVLGAIREYRLPSTGLLFLTQDGYPITPNYVSLTLSRHFRRWGIASTPHALRHWFATRLLATTHDLRVVSETLGHASVNTTTIYADWDRQVAREGVIALEIPTESVKTKPRRTRR